MEQRKLLLERLQFTTGTPKKIHQNACQNFASPLKAPPTGGRIHKKIELFMRKVAHLAHLRIHELVGELNKEGIKIRATVVQQVEYVFMYVITQTSLAQDRHIDQVIMCILYGVCKINRITITFKQIIEKYLGQPQANSQTFRLVRLTGATKFGDIIKFYNSIFLTSVESFLLEFEVADEHNTEEPCALNLRVYSPLKLHKSPQKIHNLLVSPRRTPLLLRDQANKSGNANSLVLGTLKSPQSDFERINSTINKTSNTNTVNRAKRRFDYSLSSPDPPTSPVQDIPQPITSPSTSPVSSLISTTTMGGLERVHEVGESHMRGRAEGGMDEDEMEEDYDEEEEGDEVVDEEEDDEEDEEDEEEEVLRVDPGSRKRRQDAIVVASLVEDSNKKTKRTR